jgi:hypothetical protein
MKDVVKNYYIKLITILVLYFISYFVVLSNISTDYFQIFIFGYLVICFLFFYSVSYIDKQVNIEVDHIV